MDLEVQESNPIVVIGDVHFKHTQPYLKKVIQFFDWLHTKYPDCVLVQTGDFFDTASPHSESVVDKALDCLLKFKEVHIVSGNHELSNRVGNPLIPLNRFERIHIYTKPEKVKIQDKSFLMLPFLYNVKAMKEEYESMQESCDYVVSHIAYPGTNFGSPDEINLSNIKAKAYIYGHIHQPMDKPNNHYILGVPVTTRHGEQDWKKRICKITDKIQFENIPVDVKFQTIDFNEDVEIEKDIILNVKEAPSVKAVLEKFKGNHIRLSGVTLIGEKEKITYNEQKEFLNFSLEKNFEEFSKEIEIRKNVHSKIYEFFSKIA